MKPALPAPGPGPVLPTRPARPALPTLALCAGILSGLAAVYFPIHSEIQAGQHARESDQKSAVERAAQAQKDWGLLLHRLADDEAAIAFLETQMPKDKREILQAVAQARSQARVAEEQAPLRMEKSARKKARTGRMK